MEKYTVFMDKKNQYSENEYTTKKKQSVDSMQSLSSYEWHFSENQNKYIHNLYGSTKKSQIVKAILRKKN